jgi:hypothetical protein
MINADRWLQMRPPAGSDWARLAVLPTNPKAKPPLQYLNLETEDDAAYRAA